ncbi:GNAT family N-acetyltransferase [Paenibacillus sp. CMAA1364]
MDMKLELVPRKRKRVIDHLMQFYLYDFSEYLEMELTDSGDFEGYPDLDTYWDYDHGKYALMISVHNKPAGFALVERLQDSSEGDYYMTEFFVMKGYRRTGVGRWAVNEIFTRYRGNWKVTQLSNNLPAQKFWRKVIGEYTHEDYVEKVHADNANISQYFKS